MTHTCHPADRRKRNLRRQLAAGIVQQRVYFNFITHYRSFRECQLPSLPPVLFPPRIFIARITLPLPRPSFYEDSRRGGGREKGREGRRKNHGEAISRKRPSVTCHSRDYTIIAFPFHHQTYEYEIRMYTIFSQMWIPALFADNYSDALVSNVFRSFEFILSIKRNHKIVNTFLCNIFNFKDLLDRDSGIKFQLPFHRGKKEERAIKAKGLEFQVGARHGSNLLSKS